MADATCAAQPSTQTTLDKIFTDFWAKLNSQLQAPTLQTPGPTSLHERPPSTLPLPAALAPGRRPPRNHRPAAKNMRNSARLTVFRRRGSPEDAPEK
ncbi:Hypothetical predicted protein [Pelobates cultripes]|uniref:Uncharacterized protein n=1 Tax=Pelobates cultripes TaxID=61616 RepID=A0AAD1S8E1_PELCU|nr:Hypothetical predicted protein [Pelobates cultripes]